MKANFLKEIIQEQFKKEGNSMYSNNTDIILDYLNNHKEKQVQSININEIEKGKFCFLFFDLQGKTSKLEKFNTLLPLDWVDMDGTRYLYALSINFMPVAIRVVFFNSLFNQSIKTFDDIDDKMPNKQDVLNGISLGSIYKALKSIGFEWAIRRFDIRYINKVNIINWNVIHKFISMSTAKLTGVDDNKLIDIWKSKLDKQEVRQKEFMSKLLGDYKEMEKELGLGFQSLTEAEDNLYKSLSFYKSL